MAHMSPSRLCPWHIARTAETNVSTLSEEPRGFLTTHGGLLPALAVSANSAYLYRCDRFINAGIDRVVLQPPQALGTHLLLVSANDIQLSLCRATRRLQPHRRQCFLSATPSLRMSMQRHNMSVAQRAGVMMRRRARQLWLLKRRDFVCSNACPLQEISTHDLTSVTSCACAALPACSMSTMCDASTRARPRDWMNASSVVGRSNRICAC